MSLELCAQSNFSPPQTFYFSTWRPKQIQFRKLIVWKPKMVNNVQYNIKFIGVYTWRELGPWHAHVYTYVCLKVRQRALPHAPLWDRGKYFHAPTCLTNEHWSIRIFVACSGTTSFWRRATLDGIKTSVILISTIFMNLLSFFLVSNTKYRDYFLK